MLFLKFDPISDSSSRFEDKELERKFPEGMKRSSFCKGSFVVIYNANNHKEYVIAKKQQLKNIILFDFWYQTMRAYNFC